MKAKAISIVCGLAAGILLLPATVHAQTYDVPSDNSFKTYMSYRAITNTASKQYQLQEQSVTNSDGIRTYNGRYCIAVGTYYTDTVGTYIDVTLDDGSVLPCVTGDIKSDDDTDKLNRQIPSNGNVVEFIVDTDALPSEARSTGDISAISEFTGDIVEINVCGSDTVEEESAVTDIIMTYRTTPPDAVIYRTTVK